jgi:hypothetical protein
MKNPMRCKTKQRKGSRPVRILGYRRTMANENSPGSRRNPGEMNDHPREQSRRQNSAYRHRNMKGAFGNEGALRLYSRLSNLCIELIAHLRELSPMEPRMHISTILRLLELEQRISNSNVFISNARTETARTLMKHLGDICGAVIRYTTADIKSPPQSARMAPAAIALLARLIIEQYETLYYLCFEKVSKSEREFRIELFGLHAQREAVKVKLPLPKFSSGGDESIWSMVLQSYVMTLQKNRCFMNLPERIQSHLLEGRTPFFNLRTQTYGRGIHRSAEIAALYKLFSNVAHSTALGLHAIRATPHRQTIDGQNLIALALCCCVRLLAAALDDRTKLRPRLRAVVSSSDRAFLADERGHPLHLWEARRTKV